MNRNSNKKELTLTDVIFTWYTGAIVGFAAGRLLGDTSTALIGLAVGALCGLLLQKKHHSK